MHLFSMKNYYIFRYQTGPISASFFLIMAEESDRVRLIIIR